MDLVKQAYTLLREWKKGRYTFGVGTLPEVGKLSAQYGKTALVVANTTYLKPVADAVIAALQDAGVILLTDAPVPDARPNAPREDVYRIESYILHHRPDCLVAVGGGSTIDACKAAALLATLGKQATPEIDHYFGTGIVTRELETAGLSMLPVIAVQTSASSGAHLTKYANITDPVIGQKKLIVDDAITPAAALFDYRTTVSMPLSVTVDGALDAIAHTYEVFLGAKPETYELAGKLAETAISLVIENMPRLLENAGDLQAREALGLATDLGGYAIMVGGTSGAHLTSFSLVDLTAHGTACGLMNPYYTVFYAPAIQPQLRLLASLFEAHGLLTADRTALQGRALALAVADAMIAFSRSIGAPTTLGELKGFSDRHVKQILEAAKDPQLKMKLQNMPVPMTADDVDVYMAPLIQAAVTGDMSRIVNKP
jgi:alcohol dehydrogenase